MTVLQGLRIFGPCSNADLARKMGRDPQRVYSSVYRLREAGLADRLGPALYDITEAGRAKFDSDGVTLPVEPKAEYLPLFPEDR